MRTRIVILVMVLATAASAQWVKVDSGLHVMEYASPVKSFMGNSVITVLKIDPDVYRFHIFTEPDWVKGKTARDWCEQHGQVAAINAGMYTPEGRNCGYMIANGKQNGWENKGNAIFAFDGEGLPVQIIDRQCQDWPDMKTKYRGLTQSIRMVDCNQQNRWTLQEKKWSVACLAIDRSGNVLMIHCRSPYRMHDFINIMLSGPFDIYNMMYLEGGPEASLYIKTETICVEQMGSYETDFFESDCNYQYWKIPNVITISKR